MLKKSGDGNYYFAVIARIADALGDNLYDARKIFNEQIFFALEMRVESRTPDVEKTVEDNNFDYAHLRPALFMQNVFHFAPGLRETGTIHYPFGDVRHAQIDVRDIGAAAAACLLREGEIRAAFHLTGAEAFTFEEMATILTEVTGCTIHYRALEPDEFARMIKDSGVPEWLIEHIIEMSQALKSGLGTTPTTDVRKITGRTPISFRHFAEDYKKQLQELVNVDESNHNHTEIKHNHY